MVNTATKVSASPNRLTYLLTGDGTVIGPTIANATLVADMVNGPLKDKWSTVWTTQAAMRQNLLGRLAHCAIELQLVATGVDVTAQVNQVVADVDTDAVSITKAEINIGMSDTTGQLCYMHLIHDHSVVQ